ncbi:large conductance mechanosensitive channel protein MscL [Streptomyces carminius]|uniref:Large-conductance mechanosensitive channel n=1 Tax=Streptomyces carminius TaxID=2665496 RepID=A0A2M8LYF8_9ACTN|nr:large conductance mechanosensitive channel protein MscL [Streptomyces carminius]PJE97006.1 large conductance mechanosensitive channel protein MscL [Streptomyces carminius]PJE97715.1 large conductance mechanosensitive channel protein MscL [Streptomyces carminius]
MSEKQGVLNGFKAFLMRGNVVDLAVAVVIGAAFTKIVNSVVEGVINPVVGSIGPKDLDRYHSCLQGPCEIDESTGAVINGITIKWGTVLSASLTFLITAAVVYFLMIVPMNKLKKRLDALDTEEAAEMAATPAQKSEVELLAEIRDTLVALRAEQGPAAGAAGLGPQRGAPGGPGFTGGEGTGRA